MSSNKKKRRHDGYSTPIATIPIYELKNPKSDIFINEYYDDWENYRDGFRNIYEDYKSLKRLPIRYLERTESGQIRLKMNDKIKRQLQIRKAKKQGKHL